MIPLFACVALIHGRHVAADYSKTWNTVSQTISTLYYARKTRHEEMERLLAKYKPIASAASTREVFEQNVNAMIAEFHDSHFGFFSKEDQTYYLMDSMGGGGSPMPEIGAWFQQTSAGYVVKMVLDGSSAAKAGLRKGDIVRTVDDEPFTPVDSLKDKVGKKATLEVSRDGQTLSIPVDVVSKTALTMFLDATNDSVKVLDDGPRKIGYIHLWTQLGGGFANALSRAVYGELSKTDAIVLDLRDGFGGRPEGFADPFFRPGVTIEWESPGSKSVDLFGYQKPLVVLINEGSRSAKEILSYILKKSKRATLIGTTTAGNVLGTSPRRVEDWAYLELPIVDVVTDGMRLEGVGVKPDISVRPEFDSSGKDLILARALEFLAPRA